MYRVVLGTTLCGSKFLEQMDKFKAWLALSPCLVLKESESEIKFQILPKKEVLKNSLDLKGEKESTKA